MRLSKTVMAAGLAAILAVSAGPIAAFGQDATTSLSLDAPRGFQLRGGALQPDGEGVRAHGQLCRVSGVGPWPSRIRLDTLTMDGEVVAETTTTIGPISARKTGCVVYTVSAHWRPEAGQAVRLSAF